jgi:hypothetical protein
VKKQWKLYAAFFFVTSLAMSWLQIFVAVHSSCTSSRSSEGDLDLQPAL